MLNNIAFIGGIHGVGKSTISRKICSELGIEYLSASELLKWKIINKDQKNKNVKNISDTQNRLINGLRDTVEEDKFYLLDGHYCLLDKFNTIINIPSDVFKQFNPSSLNLILGNISEIKNRLETRDNKIYEYELLQHLQNSELIYARSLSEILNIPLNIGMNNDYSNILASLSKMKIK